MQSHSFGPTQLGSESGYRPGSPRQRLVSTILSIGIILLVVLAAIYQTQVVPMRERPQATTTFDVRGSEGDKSDTGEKKPEKQKKEDKQKVADVDQPLPVETPVPKPEAPQQELSFIKLSSSEFAAADIGKLAPAGGSKGAAGAKGSSVQGPGEGPGGVVLYAADWYRKPTDAQLSGYLPANRPREGWGVVACQTVERYHVENSQILGEAPQGSGFGRAVLNAAWQFLVIPPRVNGKPQVGEWVRIRIDYSMSNVRVSG